MKKVKKSFSGAKEQRRKGAKEQIPKGAKTQVEDDEVLIGDIKPLKASKSTKANPKMSVSVPEEIRQAMTNAATLLGAPRNEIVEEAFEDWLNKNKDMLSQLSKENAYLPSLPA